MKKFITITIGLIFAVIIGSLWWNTQLKGVSSDTKTKVFVIPKGAGVSEIAKKLKEENLIKSELAFKIYINQNKLKDKLQAGSYKLSSSMSVAELVGNLQTGSEDIWITLIEGWRVEEMAEALSSKFVFQEKNGASQQIQSSKFLEEAKGLEGYLFPDTYLFPKDATASYIIDTLRKTFDSKFNEDLKTKIRSKGLTEKEGVILASIVEREARSQKVREEVASILLKRFRIGMGLNADATLQYILGYQPAEKSWWKRHLSSEDKKVDSPYNTYMYRGLPPKPICNPSLSSLQAVANANPNTQYLYYYHDSKGNSYYAKTLEEHNQNVANNP